MEAAEVNVTKLHSKEASAPINCTEMAHPPPPAKKTCYRCGGHDHAPGDSQFLEYICNKCKKKGHLAKACRKPEVPSCKLTSTGKPKTSPVETPCKFCNSKQSHQTHAIREPVAEDTVTPLFKV